MLHLGDDDLVALAEREPGSKCRVDAADSKASVASSASW